MNTQSQLARFGELSRAAAPMICALLERQYELVGSRYGGVDLLKGGQVPEWFDFMIEMARLRLGSAFAGGSSRRRFGLSPESVDARLAAVGLTIDEISDPVKTPEVREKINSQPWLWGYSEERHGRFPDYATATALLMAEAERKGISVGSGSPVDVSAVRNRFASTAKPFGFAPKSPRFGFTALLHRPSSGGLGVYLGIKIDSDRKIPYPASISLEVMPDIDFHTLDPWFDASYKQGWLFHSLSMLGESGAYGFAPTSATFELCLRAKETILEAVLPILVQVCDDT